MVPNAIFTINLFNRQFGLYLYGLFIGIGIIVCLILLYLLTKKKGMPEYIQDYAFIVGIAAIVIGFIAAKFFQAVYDWIGSGFTSFDFANAGITAMGGFIGGAGAFILIYFVAGKFAFKGIKKDIYKKEFNKILIVSPICITIAHAFGRIGCLMAGCCHGAYLGNDYVLGGIYMRAADTGKWGYYIPTQLYEALFLFALCFVLIYLFLHDCNITHVIYLIAYGIWRMFIEFFRTDTRFASSSVSTIFDILSPSQWQSLLFIVAGIAILIIYKILKIPYWNKKESA